MLSKVKLALQISDSMFDSEITDLIAAAIKDLNVSGATEITSLMNDALAERAIITYCMYQFEYAHGNLTRADRLKEAYNDLKGTLKSATGYTTWS